MADSGIVSIIETELEQARDISQTRSLAELREATGAGHDDLMEALAELQDDGRVSEVAPGEYMRADTGVIEHVDVPPARRNGHADDVEEPGISLAEAERGRPAQPGRYPARGGERKTTLTRGVAAALDEESLGRLVKAGMDEAAAAGAIFVFEVTP